MHGEALAAAYGPVDEPVVMSLRELLGAISAYEWHRKGVEVPSLGARVHPRFGIFAPVRGEYVDLVAGAPLPATDVAFDIGTGVLSAVLLSRGVGKVMATDQDVRALDCARDNLTRLGFADRVGPVRTDLFPPGRASLVGCRLVRVMPWLYCGSISLRLVGNWSTEIPADRTCPAPCPHPARSSSPSTVVPPLQGLPPHVQRPQRGVYVPF